MEHKHDYCDDCGEPHSNDRYDICPKCEEEDETIDAIRLERQAQDCWNNEQYDHWRLTTLKGFNNEEEV
ncbi:MAG: hypothetical protein ACYS5F_15705 [Planctomycetota bacterium]|jgi:hypothetical protein